MEESTEEARSQLTVDPFFRVLSSDGTARLGRLKVPGKNDLMTPALLPVANIMTGTTPRGGGIWKYVLRNLFKSHRSIMTQALQFLDFGLNSSQLQAWLRRGPIVDQHMKHYREDEPRLGIHEYRGQLYMDSGGYKFLQNRRLDLTPFGIPPGPDTWSGILLIQNGLGGDVYVPLDYPLKLGLVNDEAAELIESSIENALKLLRNLSEGSKPVPPILIPCHGRSYEEMRSTVSRLFAQLNAEGLPLHQVGIGIGSLVPLRSSHRVETIVSVVQGAIDGIPEHLRDTIPLHAFGITGTMLPVLSFMGVDTFDSSTYVQNARSLHYFHPERCVKVAFLEMEADVLPCECPHCVGHSYRVMHEVLVEAAAGERRHGLLKSEVYAAIALHNLYYDDRFVSQTLTAIEAGTIEDFLIEHARSFPSIRPAVELAARNSQSMLASLSRDYFVMRAEIRKENYRLPEGPMDLTAYEPGPPPWLPVNLPPSEKRTPEFRYPRVSLKYTPDSFHIPTSWEPAPEKDVLLVLPCSYIKPYRESRTHHSVMSHLAERLASVGRIQKVTLSGLYGPVPAEFEDEAAVLEYDFHLTAADGAQIALCTRRLANFLDCYASRFVLRVGYATSRAYREVMYRATGLSRGFLLLPQTPAKQQLTELFRRAHLDALADHIVREVLISERVVANPSPA